MGAPDNSCCIEMHKILRKHSARF